MILPTEIKAQLMINCRTHKKFFDLLTANLASFWVESIVVAILPETLFKNHRIAHLLFSSLCITESRYLSSAKKWQQAIWEIRSTIESTSTIEICWLPSKGEYTYIFNICHDFFQRRWSKEAYQPAVAMPQPMSRKSIKTAEKIVTIECQKESPYLRHF